MPPALWCLAKLHVMPVRILNVDLFGTIGPKLAKILDAFRFQFRHNFLNIAHRDGEMSSSMVRMDFLFPIPNQVQFVVTDRIPGSRKIKVRTREFFKSKQARVEGSAGLYVSDVDGNMIKLFDFHKLFVVDGLLHVNLKVNPKRSTTRAKKQPEQMMLGLL